MNTKRIVVPVLLLTLSACASAVIKDDDIVRKTAFSMGLDQSDFTIANRTNDGVQTTYTMTTKSGKKYNCSIDGSFSFGTGRIITDPICNEVGKAESKNSGDKSCNALLKAAGKCK